MADQDKRPQWDLLVPWSRAAEAMGVTSEQLREWHEKYGVPAVTTPAGHWRGYRSWIDMVLRSARPGQAPNIADVTEQWWRTHNPDALKEVA